MKATSKKMTTSKVQTKPIQEDRFSADYVIDAYLKGHNDGSGMNLEDIIKDSLKTLKDSLEVANDFYKNHLSGLVCVSSFFKTNFPDKISYLFAIDENIYFDFEQRKALYLSSSKYMQKSQFVFFSFMPCKNKDSINMASIKADNYIEM